MNGYDGDDFGSLNVGYFLGKKTSDSSVVIKCICCRPESRGTFSVDPALATVDVPSTDTQPAEFRRNSYYPIFSKQSSSGPPDPKFYCFFRAGSTNTYDLYHVQPITFRGVISEVIGAILMYAGYTAANVDQDSFDECYDAENNVGADNTERPYVWVTPEQGETVMATIKRVMQHWNHILTYNKEGKIAIRPADSFYEFFSALDSHANIKSLKIRSEKDMILNKCIAMHGQYVRFVDYPNAGSPVPDFNAYFEPTLKSDITQAFIDEYSDTSSITKYGERQYGDRVRTTLEPSPGTFVGVGRRDGSGPLVPDVARSVTKYTEGDPIKVAHYPFVHQKDIKDNIMLRFITNEAKMRKIIEVEQDFLGLDYDIGSIVYVPSEDSEFRCMRQTVDFNSLTVRSVLITNHPCEYTTASTTVWGNVDWDSAPVGTTNLTESSGTMTLEIDLSMGAAVDWHYRIFISKDYGPWEEFYTTGWESITGALDIQDSWSGNTQVVEVIIKAADDDGSGGQCTPTPWVRMPTATQ
jgi:hypothetical protein